MKAPSRFVIAGQTFEVTVTAVGEEMVDGLEYTKTSLGTSNVDMGRVKIRDASAQSFDQQRDTYLHEMLHCMVRLSGLDEDALGKHGREERVVDRLATILYDTFRRNPRVVAYLMERRP